MSEAAELHMSRPAGQAFATVRARRVRRSLPAGFVWGEAGGEVLLY